MNSFGINSQKPTYVTGSGSNIKSALNGMGNRLDCAAHMVNSTVQYSLKFKNHQKDEIKNTLESCRALVTYFKRAELQNALSKTLKAEGGTRWNGTLRMLKSIDDVWTDIEQLLIERKCELTRKY